VPGDLKRHLAPDAQRLYELIWKRTVASQMESARLEQVAVDIAVDRDAARLRANGSVVLFDGFLTLYQESRDEPQEGESREPREPRLPKLTEGEGLTREGVTPEQHFTQPPPRFTEASLVKRLEELGIGRPSTYASILQVLQDRDYVWLEKRRFLPQDRGRLVTAFLTSFFQRYVEYGFTADMEAKLDEISGGRIAWRDVLQQFWEAFHKVVDETKGLRIAAVIDALDEDLGPHFFPTDPEKPEVDLRTCPSCKTGRLGLRLAKNGGFIGCSNYPDCRYTRPLAVPGNGEDAMLGEGTNCWDRIRRAACRSHCARAPTASTPSWAKPRTAKSRSAFRCRATCRSIRLRSIGPLPCSPCHARSAGTRKAGSRSMPASAVTAPTSGTGEPTAR
jgi:DNA topoisomerase-1